MKKILSFYIALQLHKFFPLNDQITLLLTLKGKMRFFGSNIKNQKFFTIAEQLCVDNIQLGSYLMILSKTCLDTCHFFVRKSWEIAPGKFNLPRLMERLVDKVDMDPFSGDDCILDLGLPKMN